MSTAAGSAAQTHLKKLNVQGAVKLLCDTAHFLQFKSRHVFEQNIQFDVLQLSTQDNIRLALMWVVNRFQLMFGKNLLTPLQTNYLKEVTLMPQVILNQSEMCSLKRGT